MNIPWCADLNNYGLQLIYKAPGDVQNWRKEAGQITAQKKY